MKRKQHRLSRQAAEHVHFIVRKFLEYARKDYTRHEGWLSAAHYVMKFGASQRTIDYFVEFCIRKSTRLFAYGLPEPAMSVAKLGASERVRARLVNYIIRDCGAGISQKAVSELQGRDLTADEILRLAQIYFSPGHAAKSASEDERIMNLASVHLDSKGRARVHKWKKQRDESWDLF